MSDKASTNSQTQEPFEPARSTVANTWLSEGQSNDRIPMNGSVDNADRPPAEHRAFARRSHQVMFKKWSQTRHD